MKYYIRVITPPVQELVDSPIIPTVGVIFPENMLPNLHGWMECDGREVDSLVYPELFSIIGYRFGTAHDPICFKLPDLRQYRP